MIFVMMMCIAVVVIIVIVITAFIMFKFLSFVTIAYCKRVAGVVRRLVLNIRVLRLVGSAC